jgi:phage shock protein E
MADDTGGGMKANTNKSGRSRPALRPGAGTLVAALIVIVLAAAACQAVGTGPSAAPAATAAAAPAAPVTKRALPAEVSVAEAAAKRDAGAFILDVRTPDEWKEFHVPGSTLIPVTELANRVAEVPQDREVVVVCRSGNRSATGRDLLLKAGYPQVTSLAGGLTAWRSAGKPVE